MRERILILCTGNSSRSQMAEAFLKSYDSRMEVFSAGTEPAKEVHPMAIKVMAELDIDISQNKPKIVNPFINQSFDYVITVCGDANRNCPEFAGKVKNRWHLEFDDPAKVEGTDQEILDAFREIRDQIGEGFLSFYKSQMAPSSCGSCSCCGGC
ncbi:MAG: arsenate reductase ArsC [Salinivirgaceae bacterium]|nr:arsenate reductase ArsC [Salinivirgaceae bacterium]MDD4747632.1 arsenate reductase ArsC [Salinivirgaceae bacterium]MDY0280338.1 arsenate reductase ArsC [Salinivirgaceae bacterium]